MLDQLNNITLLFKEYWALILACLIVLIVLTIAVPIISSVLKAGFRKRRGAAEESGDEPLRKKTVGELIFSEFLGIETLIIILLILSCVVGLIAALLGAFLKSSAEILGTLELVGLISLCVCGFLFVLEVIVRILRINSYLANQEKVFARLEAQKAAEETAEDAPVEETTEEESVEEGAEEAAEEEPVEETAEESPVEEVTEEEPVEESANEAPVEEDAEETAEEASAEETTDEAPVEEAQAEEVTETDGGESSDK